MFKFLYEGKLGELIAPLQSDEGALQDAVATGKQDRFDELIAKGVSPAVKTRTGSTLMHIACHNGQIEMAERLLQLGVGVADADDSGNTPLHYAARSGKTEVVRFLLGNGAPAEPRSAQGQTPYDVSSNPAASQLILSYVFPTQQPGAATAPAYPGAAPAAAEAGAAPPAGAGTRVDASGASRPMSFREQVGDGVHGIRADGFVSSAANPHLAARYGNVAAAGPAAAPPPMGGPPVQGVTQMAGGANPYARGRYVAYNAHTHSAGNVVMPTTAPPGGAPAHGMAAPPPQAQFQQFQQFQQFHPPAAAAGTPAVGGPIAAAPPPAGGGKAHPFGGARSAPGATAGDSALDGGASHGAAVANG